MLKTAVWYNKSQNIKQVVNPATDPYNNTQDNVPLIKLAALIKAIFCHNGWTRHNVQAVPPSYGQMGRIGHRTSPDNAWSGYRCISAYSRHTNQLREQSSIATQQHLALWKKTIHGNQSPKIDRKARTPCARHGMDLPPFFHLYASIAYALSEIKRLLLKSLREFQDILNSLKKGTYIGTNTYETRHISFAMKGHQILSIMPNTDPTSTRLCAKK